MKSNFSGVSEVRGIMVGRDSSISAKSSPVIPIDLYNSTVGLIIFFKSYVRMEGFLRMAFWRVCFDPNMFSR